MGKNANYASAGDPIDFAPDFSETPEPYGQPVDEMVDLFRNIAPMTVLDVAGGYGKYGIPIMNLGHHVTIADLHQPSLDEAIKRRSERSNGTGSLEVMNTDVIRNELAPSSYDVALCVGFIHHLDRQGIKDLFDTMSRLVRPGGWLVLDFSTDKFRRHPDGTPILVNGDPEQNMTHAQARELLDELYSLHGFDVDYRDVVLYERQDDFWYDATMIIAKGVRRQQTGRSD